MSYAVPYNPKSDLDAFYGALASGSLAQMDAGDVVDLADRADSGSGRTLEYLGMGRKDAPPGFVRDQLLDTYYGELAAVACAEGAEAADAEASSDLRHRMESVAARACVPFDTVMSALDDPVSYDRIMETYYRS